jgi:hypothetical protein
MLFLKDIHFLAAGLAAAGLAAAAAAGLAAGAAGFFTFLTFLPDFLSSALAFFILSLNLPVSSVTIRFLYLK